MQLTNILFKQCITNIVTIKHHRLTTFYLQIQKNYIKTVQPYNPPMELLPTQNWVSHLDGLTTAPKSQHGQSAERNRKHKCHSTKELGKHGKIIGQII